MGRLAVDEGSVEIPKDGFHFCPPTTDDPDFETGEIAFMSTPSAKFSYAAWSKVQTTPVFARSAGSEASASASSIASGSAVLKANMP